MRLFHASYCLLGVSLTFAITSVTREDERENNSFMSAVGGRYRIFNADTGILRKLL